MSTIMGWSDLPPELLISIAKNLPNFTDHLRFRSVCSHWRSSFPSQDSLKCLPPQLPWLILPSASCPTGFYSLSEDRVYLTPPPGVPKSTRLYGSASGWLLSLSGYNHRSITVSLINPFTSALIQMPAPVPGSALSYMASDSCAWDKSESVVVAACSTRYGVFYCRLGDAVWNSVETQQHHIRASSITFHQGRFYILQADTCQTVVLDGETLEQITVIGAPNVGYPVEAHLLVSSGDLLLLVKSTWIYLFPGSESEVYKVWHVNLNDALTDWVEINEIGDRALFVDNLHCFSVQVGDNSLLRPNCIYSPQYRSNDSVMTYSISIFYVGTCCGERLQGALSKFHALSWRGAGSSLSWILPSLS